MTDIQGALGCAQMDRADWILDERRRRAAASTTSALAGVDWLRTPVTPEGNVHGYQSYVLPVRARGADARRTCDALHERRNRVMARLEERGIATRQGTHAPVADRPLREQVRPRARATSRAPSSPSA